MSTTGLLDAYGYRCLRYQRRLYGEPQNGRTPMTVMTMHVLDREGDTKIIWDSDNSDEVANARRSFDELRGKGFTAYRVDDKGDRSAIIREFDPTAEKLILRPAMAGG
jgi:hypothetical protein